MVEVGEQSITALEADEDPAEVEKVLSSDRVFK